MKGYQLPALCVEHRIGVLKTLTVVSIFHNNMETVIVQEEIAGFPIVSKSKNYANRKKGVIKKTNDDNKKNFRGYSVGKNLKSKSLFKQFTLNLLPRIKMKSFIITHGHK